MPKKNVHWEALPHIRCCACREVKMAAVTESVDHAVELDGGHEEDAAAVSSGTLYVGMELGFVQQIEQVAQTAANTGFNFICSPLVRAAAHW